MVKHTHHHQHNIHRNMILHRAEFLNNEVAPIDRFWFKDEVNEIPGMLNLIDPNERQVSSRLAAPTIQDDDNKDDTEKEKEEESEEDPAAAAAFELDFQERDIAIVVVAIIALILKKQYATLGVISLLFFLKFSVTAATK